MMATIYENAEQVIVWPGHNGIWREHDNNILRVSLNSTLTFVHDTDLPPLRSLIQQPYFTRIWPVQEIALARCCIMLLRGNNVVDIRSVFLMPHSGSKYFRTDRDKPELASLKLEYARVTTLHRQLLGFFQSRYNNSNASATPSRSPSISEVLLQARDHQASEPRDKVFALYGMLQRLQAHLEAPNYLRPIEDIYLEASAAAIHEDQSLRVLEGLTGVSSLELPSWSPDWSDHQHINKVAEWTDHNASGSSEAQPSIRGRELLARGQFIDLVYQEHVTFAATSSLLEANNLAESLAEPLRDPSNLPVERYLYLLETLFLSIWNNEDLRTATDNAHCTWVKNDAKKRAKKHTVRGLIGYRNDGEFTKGFIKRSVILHAGLCYRLDRKKLFQTRDGRLGIASEAVKSGDSIVLLQGCNLPMVVRPEGTKWKLIVPAYLPADGIMDGKLWRSDGPLGCFSFV
ncbi:hypothetical protein AG0111_0g12040 [Alternaria gaisen]|uniref:Uncharacterized protein n=1 Tax=Alternaria gaisen TaxID=167740 RepID=A0ACB6F5R7_9PLEO|nr:hypothetical protein AG0111_0g12040 [Alternaria gaisen]